MLRGTVEGWGGLVRTEDPQRAWGHCCRNTLEDWRYCRGKDSSGRLGGNVEHCWNLRALWGYWRHECMLEESTVGD